MAPLLLFFPALFITMPAYCACGCGKQVSYKGRYAGACAKEAAAEGKSMAFQKQTNLKVRSTVFLLTISC